MGTNSWAWVLYPRAHASSPWQWALLLAATSATALNQARRHAHQQVCEAAMAAAGLLATLFLSSSRARILAAAGDTIQKHDFREQSSRVENATETSPNTPITTGKPLEDEPKSRSRRGGAAGWRALTPDQRSERARSIVAHRYNRTPSAPPSRSLHRE